MARVLVYLMEAPRTRLSGVGDDLTLKLPADYYGSDLGCYPRWVMAPDSNGTSEDLTMERM